MSNRSVVFGQVSLNITHKNNMYEDIPSGNNTLMLVTRTLCVTINDDDFDNNDCSCDQNDIQAHAINKFDTLTIKIVNKMMIKITQSRILY